MMTRITINGSFDGYACKRELVEKFREWLPDADPMQLADAFCDIEEYGSMTFVAASGDVIRIFYV